jgi:hypothetical protein
MAKKSEKRDRRIARTRHAVLDKESLSIAVAYFIEVAGNPILAADACGTKSFRSTLYNLRDCKRVELADDTVAKLQKGFDAFELPFSVAEFLSSPSETQARNEHNRWLRHWADRAVLEEVPPGDGEPRWRPSAARRRELRRMINRVNRLDANLLLEFIERSREVGRHSKERIAIAVYSIFEPLLQVRNSGYVELGEEELLDPDFLRFVKAGIKRQALLLSRSPDLQRLRNGDDRRRSRTTDRGLVEDANYFIRLLQSRGVPRKRWGIADLMEGRRHSDRPYEPDAEEIVSLVPSKLWPSDKKRNSAPDAPEREPALDPAVLLLRLEKERVAKRRLEKEQARR